MSTITIHALDKEVEKVIRGKARSERKSLNQTIKELLAEQVGAGGSPRSDRQEDFAEFLGIWSERESREFEDAVADFGRVDPEEWR